MNSASKWTIAMASLRFSLLFTLICLGLAWWWGGTQGMFLALMLGVLEVSLSYDNAVVNAAVMRAWSQRWRTLFLTVGIFIAVFGMRLFFPIAIVAVATGWDFLVVARLALEQPAAYTVHLTAHHVPVAAFGGMFLLMVCLTFLLDAGKQVHWLTPLESRLARLGRINGMAVLLALGALLASRSLLPTVDQPAALIAGVWGVVVFLLVRGVADLCEGGSASHKTGRYASQGGFMGFLYLELLDASFSFDGVIGAFAVTRDVVIIMLGLGIGAIFVRSMTVCLVEQGTLDKYIYLEHGAHYAIGVLALVMLASMTLHIPQLFTATSGLVIILASAWSSLKKRHAQGG